jgi:hypothetical protein
LKADLPIIRDLKQECEKEYITLVKKETDRDETCSININDDQFLDDGNNH